MEYARGCEGVRMDAFLFLCVFHCLQLVVHYVLAVYDVT